MGRFAPQSRLAGMSGPLLTAAEVAELLGVPKSWVYEQSRKGSIPTVTLGRYRRYRAEAISTWIERLEAGERAGSRLASLR
jgi:excisionase family DNA binding protein